MRMPVVPSLHELPFDRVVIGDQTYSVEEFLRLPLTTRVRHILRREATFLQGDTPVEATAALNGLRLVTAAEKTPR
jgi:hypothetical protein